MNSNESEVCAKVIGMHVFTNYQKTLPRRGSYRQFYLDSGLAHTAIINYFTSIKIKERFVYSPNVNTKDR